MLVPMVLVWVRLPKSTLDRKSFLHRQSNCLVSEFPFVVEAMFPLRDHHLHAIDATFKKKFFSLISWSTKSPRVSLSRSAYNLLPGSRICAGRYRLVMILYFVWSSSMLCKRCGHKATASLDRERAVQVDSYLTRSFGQYFLLFLLFGRGDNVSQKSCNHRSIRQPFFGSIKVRLRGQS